METKNDIDLCGKLIIKVQLGDDIRRIPIHNEAITFDELVLMMQRVFRGKLSANDDITIKYKDEDGDLITIFDSSDLSFAIQCSRILKLEIQLTADVKKESTTVLTHNDVIKLKDQLRSLRDQVNKLLDGLDIPYTTTDSSHAKDDAGSTEQSNSGGGSAPLNKVNSSEFDPLQDKSQKNGMEDGKDSHSVPPKTASTPKQNDTPSNSRPQSVAMPPPASGQQPVTPASISGHTAPSDYFNRTATTSYPQMQYTSLPYQPYNYPPSNAYMMDNSQVGGTGSFTNPGQSNLPYPAQQYNQPPAGVVFPSQTQGGNPYSKGYTQPSPQHGYIPPRQ